MLFTKCISKRYQAEVEELGMEEIALYKRRLLINKDMSKSHVHTECDEHNEK